MKKRILVVFSLLIAIILICTNAYADTLDQQRQSAERQVRKAQKSLDDINEERNLVMEQVNNLNQSITENEAEVSRLEAEIEKLNKSIDFKQKDIDEKQKLLDERLSAVYMSNGNTYLEALFNGGIVNFVSNYDIIKQIAEYDNNLIEEVQKEREELENSKMAKENSMRQYEEKLKALNDQKTEREEKLEKLTTEQQSMQASVREKQSELSRISEEVRDATTSADRSGGAIVSSGGMAWPTRIAHRVNSIYAPNGRYDTSGYVGTAHKGIDIYAPSGTPIYAAQEGTVVYVNYSGYGGGWGLYVVIYHGKDSGGQPIYTRYAHASSIASGISVGSHVTTNTVIMYSGNTGASEGAHLHFEVCVGGMYSQVNPCGYLGISNTKGEH